jgi:GNAT superfamily N-acetyltransferase
MLDTYPNIQTANRVVEQNSVNYVKFIASLPRFEIREEKDVFWISADAPVFYFNSVFNARLNGNTEQKIETIIEFFRARRDWFTWHVIPSSQPENLAQLLMARGAELLESIPYMAVDLDVLQRDFSMPSGFRWKAVRTHNELASWTSIYCHARGYPESAHKLFNIFADLDLTEEFPFQLILGYLGNTPVSTYSVFMDDETAGFYSLTTLPEARGHGIGTAISIAAADLAAERGYQIATLLSEPPSRNICKRLGFVDGFGDMNIYRLPSR